MSFALAAMLLQAAATANPLPWCVNSTSPSPAYVFEWGPLHFERLVGLTCSWAPAGNVNGLDQYSVQMAVGAANFRFLAADGAHSVIRGQAATIAIDGVVAVDPGKRSAFLSVPTGQLRFNVRTATEVRSKLGAGQIVVPVGTEFTVTNGSPAYIAGASTGRRTGELVLVSSTQMRWVDLHARLRAYPEDLVFSVHSTPGTESIWALDIHDRSLRVTNGSFSRGTTSLPRNKAPANAVTATYRARIQSASIQALEVSIARNLVRIKASAVQLTGSLVGNADGYAIGSFGILRVGLVDGVAAATPTSLIVEDVHLRGSSIQPAIAKTSVAARPQPRQPAQHFAAIDTSPWRTESWADSSLIALGLPNFTARHDSAVAESMQELGKLRDPSILVNATTVFLFAALNKKMDQKLGKLVELHAQEQLLTGVLRTAPVGEANGPPLSMIVRLSPSATPDSLRIRYDVYLPDIDNWQSPASVQFDTAVSALVSLGEKTALLVDAATVPVMLPSIKFFSTSNRLDIPAQNGLAGQITFGGYAGKLRVTSAIPLIDRAGLHFLLATRTDWARQ